MPPTLVNINGTMVWTPSNAQLDLTKQGIEITAFENPNKNNLTFFGLLPNGTHFQIEYFHNNMVKITTDYEKNPKFIDAISTILGMSPVAKYRQYYESIATGVGHIAYFHIWSIHRRRTLTAIREYPGLLDVQELPIVLYPPPK